MIRIAGDAHGASVFDGHQHRAGVGTVVRADGFDDHRGEWDCTEISQLTNGGQWGGGASPPRGGEGAAAPLSPTRAGFSLRRCSTSSRKLAHDLSDVGAENFSEFEDGAETRHVAALLDESDIAGR